MALALFVAGCGGGEAPKGGAAGGPPPEVGVVTVQESSVPQTLELTGRTSAFAMSEVRPQVSGVIQRRVFEEGSIVRAGQTLYQIDPRPFQAAYDQAVANLASARANAVSAKALAERSRPLAKMEAVSQQDLTNAEAAEQQAVASVQQQQAAVETARINLNYTRVPAPITGRIGRSLSTVGALATTDQSNPLAVIQQLDPIYVDIQQSSSDLLQLRQSLASDGVLPASAAVRLKLEDGSDYGRAGRIEFAEPMVDPNTGTVTVRARFPNPDGLLLPGMFVRAVFAQAIDPHAILVPQAGLSRDPRGAATVLVVGADNKVVLRDVTAERTLGQQWVVTSGLKAGDRVITQGTGKVRPGMVVKPVPASTPEHLNLGDGKKKG